MFCFNVCSHARVYIQLICFTLQHQEVNYIEDHMETPFQKSGNHDLITENEIDQTEVKNENEAGEDPKWYDSESQNIMDSQQLAEYISLCDEFIMSQSPNRDEQQNHKEKKCKTRLSDHYACLGPEALKKDLEECQDYELDPANIILDTPPDVRLSQLVIRLLFHFFCLRLNLFLIFLTFDWSCLGFKFL